MEEDVLTLGEGRAPTVSDLGPHSPDSMSSSLMPYGLGEDSCSEESQGQQDQTLEQMEAEEEGNLPIQPASPRYIRAEEEEEEDEDVEAPYLAPRDNT